MLPEAAGHIYHSRREHRFSDCSTVMPVFKGCTEVCLVFSAVSPRPSVPLPAIGGGGLGEVEGPGCWTLAGLSFDLSLSPLSVRNDHNWTHIHYLLSAWSLENSKRHKSICFWE